MADSSSRLKVKTGDQRKGPTIKPLTAIEGREMQMVVKKKKKKSCALYNYKESSEKVVICRTRLLAGVYKSTSVCPYAVKRRNAKAGKQLRFRPTGKFAHQKVLVTDTSVSKALL